MHNQIDQKVAEVVDKERNSKDAPGLEDEDELIAELEDSAVLDGFREKRMQQLHEEIEKARYMKNQNYGTYLAIDNEKEAMDIATAAKHVVIHFAHTNFRRCDIMDSHLRKLAPKHYEARFIKVDVEKTAFLVTRLEVRVLPCIMAFVDGKSVGRIEGFEALGNTDRFQTSLLESLLVRWKVLARAKLNEDDSLSAYTKTKELTEEDDDWD